MKTNNQSALEYYHRMKSNPEKWKAYRLRRKRWEAENKPSIRTKQREDKRARKLLAIELLGGKCLDCSGVFHPAVYEFHHRNPEEKDRDPSKMLQLSWEKISNELEKCDLLCVNCHRIRHHKEDYSVQEQHKSDVSVSVVGDHI